MCIAQKTIPLHEQKPPKLRYFCTHFFKQGTLLMRFNSKSLSWKGKCFTEDKV